MESLGKDEVKQKMTEETALDNLVTLIVQSYFDTFLRYVCSVTFWEAAVLKELCLETIYQTQISFGE